MTVPFGKSIPIELGTSIANETTFASLVYDFVPQSMTEAEDGQLTLNHEEGSAGITWQVPNGSLSFKGKCSKVSKEYVLVYDSEREVLLLERLSFNMTVKKERAPPPAGSVPSADFQAPRNVGKLLKHRAKKRDAASSSSASSTGGPAAAASAQAQGSSGAHVAQASGSADDSQAGERGKEQSTSAQGRAAESAERATGGDLPAKVARTEVTMSVLEESSSSGEESE